MFRCDGGRVPEIGTGHIVRCLLLADKLKETNEFEVAFLMKDYDGVKYVLDKGYKLYKISSDKSELKETLLAIRDFSPDIFVVDRLDTEDGYMRKVKTTGVVLITLDDLGPGQKHADITINAIRESGISLYEGPSYVVLQETSYKDFKLPKSCKRIFVSFGGYDHLNLTLKTMKALEDLTKKVEIVVVIGNFYKHKNELDAFLEKTKRKYKVYVQPKRFGEILDQADIAIVSGGTTLFEAMARGVPSLTICQYPHQLETAKRYERAGATICLGMGKSVNEDIIKMSVNNLIKNTELRKSLGDNGMLLIDGLGLERVFNLVRIVSILKWDSEFFGFKTARLHPLRLTEDIVKYAIDYCKKNEVEVLYYLSDCHDPTSVKLAEKYGFHFTDIRLTFGIDLKNYLPRKIGDGFIIREASSKDIPQLKKIAEKSYLDSRYYFDQRYPREICAKFYSDWIEKSCKGFADKVFVAKINRRVVGYITCDKKPDLESHRGCGRITLVGVDDSARGIGVGSSLVYHALNWFLKEKMREVIVVTQGRNYRAQRLYQKCGFKTILTQLWYHKWFNLEDDK